MKKKRSIGSIIYLALLVVIIISIFTTVAGGAKPKTVSYKELVDLFVNEQVTEFEVVSYTISCKLKDASVVKHTFLSFEMFKNNIFDKYVVPQHESGIIKAYDLKEGFTLPWWVSFLPYLLIIGTIVLFWVFTSKQMNGKNGAGFAKPRVKMGANEKEKKTFEDVAGADEEKEELAEIVDFLKAPKKYLDIGARIPKGVLLVGPPGTGKTLLAKAVAGEAQVPFFSISGSDFVELYVGVGASRVRSLFDEAKKSAPCIIFIDEIDAVGRHRGSGIGGGHDEREQTLNQLLVEMDGFGHYSGVIVMAATNRVDTLDPALLRAGRFDRQIYVGHPDQKGREEILKVHAKGKKFEDDVNFEDFAKSTVGFTGADLENVLNEAALLAARQNKPLISNQNIQDAVMKVVAGPEKKSRTIVEKERKLTAFHEAGHAVVRKFLDSFNDVHEISIIPRGMAGGYTMYLPKEDLSYSTKKMMFEDIVSLLGGRVSEELFLDDISTGASSDIQRATSIARSMVTKYGMSEKLGTVLYGKDNDEVFLGYDISSQKGYSESVAAQIDEEVKRIIDEAYQKAREILSQNADKVTVLSERLLEKEKISGEEFDEIMSGKEVSETVTDGESSSIFADRLSGDVDIRNNNDDNNSDTQQNEDGDSDQE